MSVDVCVVDILTILYYTYLKLDVEHRPRCVLNYLFERRVNEEPSLLSIHQLTISNVRVSATTKFLLFGAMETSVLP